jgi:hypothetical protein
MQIVSNEVQRIATLLGSAYMRTINLSEANVNIHYESVDDSLIIYNGEGLITTEFPEGYSQAIDYFDTQIYFLIKASTTDLSGSQVDTQLQITKELANKFYLDLETVVDVPEMTLQPVSISDDMLLGFEMNIRLNFYNEGC